jgi:deoxyribodipyrimidine photo-lyase
MWFASIWVYTLELPWQLGADFFLRHLVDGDPASNTLSWRWVCGLHTRGKTYLARVSNIASYTDGRFNPRGRLAISAPPLTETRGHASRPLTASDPLPGDGRLGLLVTEEDCAPESLFPGLAPEALLGLVSTDGRSPLPVGIPASDFARAAVSDALERAGEEVGVSGSVVEASDWAGPLIEWATAKKLDTIVTAWTPVGPAAEALGKAAPELERYGIELRRVRRAYDTVSWANAGRGYFKLRNNIPTILRQLKIGPFASGHRDGAAVSSSG